MCTKSLIGVSGLIERETTSFRNLNNSVVSAIAASTNDVEMHRHSMYSNALKEMVQHI
jgi:hypothetical protein